MPNELWLCIFELATFVLGSLDVKHHDPFDHGADLWNTAFLCSINKHISCTKYGLGRSEAQLRRRMHWTPMAWFSYFFPVRDYAAQVDFHRIYPLTNDRPGAGDRMLPVHGMATIPLTFSRILRIASTNVHLFVKYLYHHNKV